MSCGSWDSQNDWQDGQSILGLSCLCLFSHIYLTTYIKTIYPENTQRPWDEERVYK